MIYPSFPLDLDGFFQRKPLILFVAYKMQDFLNFVLHYCILNLDTEQVFLKLQVTNVKKKEVTAYPKPQTLGKNSKP